MASDEDAWRRYARWQGTYRVPLRVATHGGSPRRARARRIGVALLAAVVVVVAASFLVRLVVALVRWELLALLDVLINPANAFILLGLAWLRWPPQTTLAPSGLSVRSEPWRTRTIAWQDVAQVQAPGRFDQHPVALLVSAERLPLVALPLAVAEQMAAVTQPMPLPPSKATHPRVSSQEDLDGPFRRGRPTR